MHSLYWGRLPIC